MSDDPNDYVILKCPDCKKITPARKLDTDPQNTRRVILRCPECNSGDFDTEHYFDKDNNEIYNAVNEIM